MSKFLNVFVVIVALIAIGTSIEYESTLSITGQQNTKELIYTDSIMQVYNTSCIETSNYQYVMINNSKDVLRNGNIEIGNWEDIDIMIKPIKEIGPKTLLADVWV